MYTQDIQAAGGNDKDMANWVPMALMEMPGSWLRGLPEASVSSWEEFRSQLIARFAAPALHAVAAILGGLQVPASSRHTKQLFRQMGAA